MAAEEIRAYRAADPGLGPPFGFTLLAIACGWLVPGLGHAMLGRNRRGLLFAFLILGLFALGMPQE